MVEVRAQRRKFHYIYKITRTDGKYYIGMHSTDNLEDGYFGSGALLRKSIEKRGLEVHSKEILEFFNSRELLKAREKEIINEACLADKKCMNLKLGGEGGGHFWSKDQQIKASVSGNKSKKRDHSVITKKIIATKNMRGTLYVPDPRTRGMRGKIHTDNTKKLMSQSGSGEKNSQFGKCWVTDCVKPLSIKKEKLNEYLANGYSKGRKACVAELV